MNILSGKCLTIIMMVIMITDNKTEDLRNGAAGVSKEDKEKTPAA